MLKIVDSHVHLWDPAVHKYPWLAAEDTLRRPFLPADLTSATTDVAGIVVVEAGARAADAMAEVGWIEWLAADWPFIRAVVAQAPLEWGVRVEPVLAELAARPLVSGVRRNAQDEPAGFFLQPEFVAGVRQLAGLGLTLDICARAHQLPELVQLVARCPDVTFVLDHLGKPNIREGHWRMWRRDLAELAAHENVHAKLSGLTTEADHAHWQPSDVERYLSYAIEVFGPERCMFGSDWPVCTLATDYRRWLDVVHGVLDGLPPESRDRVWWGTAARIYRLS